MTNALVVKDLKKSYGKLEALKGINFEVKENEIFALIGPNGAGKTTCLRMISTILKPSYGTIQLYDMDIKKNTHEIRQNISYLPEEAGAYKNLKGIDYLKFMAELFSNDSKTQKEYVETALSIADLGERINSKIGTYSKGMTRKLLISRAVMTKPKLAILDEPTSGLDVINALEIRKKIREFSKSGMTVLVSSHNMLEIEFLCDRLAIINKGEILATGTPDKLKEKYNSRNLEDVFAEVVK